MMAAAARAAHLIVDDDPPIFSDTLAALLLGERAEELLGYHRAHGDHVVLVGARAAVVVRSRFTEDRLAEAVDRGVTQYVILGAGLDTFAWRSDLAGRVRVFEVDHPATQRWKRRLLADAGLAVPETVTFVPLDLEKEALADGLGPAGFEAGRPAFVAWLGVAMYLTPEAVGQTLAAIAGLAPGSEIVIDYMLPAHLRDAAGQAYVDAVMPVTAERGEPWLSFFAPEEMSALLDEYGFEVIAQRTEHDAVDPALWRRTGALRPSRLSMLAHARVRGRTA